MPDFTKYLDHTKTAPATLQDVLFVIKTAPINIVTYTENNFFLRQNE